MHYVFADFRLDTARYELQRAGNLVPLRGKAFDVLAYLVTHHDRVVSRDELLEQVWPEQYITESTLTSCIKTVRQALGDTGRAQRVIQTVHGRGYRFLASVSQLEAAFSEMPLASSSPLQETGLSPDAAQPVSEPTPETLDTLTSSSDAAAPLLALPLQPTPLHQSEDAERRPLTVLVCDLAQAAHLVEQLDPEDLRQVMRTYHSVCDRVLAQYEGHLAQRLDSRLVAYFGYPQAQEDAARRAVLAGLALLEACSALKVESAQGEAVTLSIRVGIDSGQVVVEAAEGEGAAPLAVGSTQSRAMQLQDKAAPQRVVISASTRHLAQGWFRFNELSPHVFEGLGTPAPIYQVIERSGAQDRLETAPRGRLTPLVGRELEVGLLLGRWEQVKQGNGQVILLSGEAGIGKSRLVQVIKDNVANEPHTRLECRSLPYFTNSALYPITDFLKRTLQFQTENTSEQNLERLEQILSQYRLPVEESVPLFASLLSLPVPQDRHPPLHLSPQRQRQKTLEAIVAMILELSERQSVLFILEDLHWTDPTTLELVGLLIDQTPTASIYTLLTCRPEFQPTWSHRSYLTEMTLYRLPRSQIERMAQEVSGGKRLPDAFIQQLMDKTDGVPLYVEEMTKAVLESGVLKKMDGHYELTGSISSLSIPATLQDLLMARLDRMATAKSIAQQAAVIGRQFSFELLQAVCQLDNAVLERELVLLVDAELVYQRGMPPQATYIFKHALVTDAAYASLLRSTRQAYHRRIVQVLEEQFPETVETQPELLAHHYTEAGLSEPAIVYWQLAGENAIQRSANMEAIVHLTRGLDLITTLPDTAMRTEQELALHIALGAPLIAIKGYVAPEVQHAHTRAWHLCQQIGDTPQLFSVLCGLQLFYSVSADFHTAYEAGEQLLSLAQRQQEPPLLVTAHYALGTNLFWLGEFPSALAQLEQGIAFYNPRQQHSFAFRSGQDHGVICLTRAAMALGSLGYADQARTRIYEALALARQMQHPYSLALALHWAMLVEYQFREGQAVRERAQAAMILSTEHGFASILPVAAVMHGWALVQQGEHEAGLEQMCGGLKIWQTTGAKLLQAFFHALIAQAYGKVGLPEEGLTILDAALALLDKHDERWCETEIRRIKGCLLFQSSKNQTEAESCFRRAITIAQNQSAKSWELRASTSLARLWQSQGKRQEAYDLLAPVYNWFTEGFDTADLIEARSLLNELSIARAP